MSFFFPHLNRNGDKSPESSGAESDGSDKLAPGSERKNSSSSLFTPLPFPFDYEQKKLLAMKGMQAGFFESMKIYVAHTNFPHKRLRVDSTRYAKTAKTLHKLPHAHSLRNISRMEKHNHAQWLYTQMKNRYVIQLYRTHTHPHPPSPSPTPSLTLTLTHPHIHSHSLTLTFTHPHIHSPSHSLTITHTHSLTQHPNNTNTTTSSIISGKTENTEPLPTHQCLQLCMVEMIIIHGYYQ